MLRNINTRVSFVAVLVLSLSFAACQDTKTLQENNQLKAQVAELTKENGQLGSQLDAVTASRDALMKENEALKVRIKGQKTKRAGTKPARKPRRT